MAKTVREGDVVRTEDAEHPLQRISYTYEMVGGIPRPIVVREDANTGEVLEKIKLY